MQASNEPPGQADGVGAGVGAGEGAGVGIGVGVPPSQDSKQAKSQLWRCVAAPGPLTEPKVILYESADHLGTPKSKL